MATLFVDKLDPQSGTALEIGSSGDTITIPSGATINLSAATQTGVGGTNTPMVFAKMSGSQSIANATETVVQFDTETFDTDSAFNTSTYKFTVPSGKAGKYLVSAYCRRSGFDSARQFMYIMSGGGNYVFENGSGSVHESVGGTILLNLSVSDEIYVKYYQNQGGAQSISNDGTWLSISKMIE